MPRPSTSRGTYVESARMRVDPRTMGNILTRHFGITDDGNLIVVDIIQQSFQPDGQADDFIVKFERQEPEQGTADGE